tara:strand:+ start:461 stop:700 length:240 start_codon:yes stop_codon:yes gene_type:complete
LQYLIFKDGEDEEEKVGQSLFVKRKTDRRKRERERERINFVLESNTEEEEGEKEAPTVLTESCSVGAVRMSMLVAEDMM